MFRVIVVVTFMVFCAAKQPKVDLKNGSIIGFDDTVDVNDTKVNIFLGIPYAKPPLGELRFRKPFPITEHWNTIEAIKWPNACLQDNDLMLLSEKSEDCLYLNIWTPVDLETDFSSDLKPVIVWFHGGGYLNGSASYAMFDGSNLAVYGNVVVVTVNYRLGVLGFLYGNQKEIGGNMGLYDQALALEWVKDSIQYFGGNPNLVTIMGESAGGKAVTHHVSSPISRNLFKHAIVMSGAGMTYLSVQPKDVAFRNAKTFAKLVDCAIDEDSTSFSQETVDCLRKVDAKRLIDTQFHPDVNLRGKNPFRTAFFPISEEPFVPKAPENLWSKGVFNQKTPLLIGTVPNEGMVTFYLSVLRNGRSKKELINILEQFFEELVPKELSINNDVIDLYFSSIGDDELVKAKTAFFTLISDAFYICPSIIFAEKYSSANNVYQYVFAHNRNDSHGFCRTFGPCHADDVPFTFGTIENDADREVSLQWIQILSEFARHGKTHWSPYYTLKSNAFVPVYYEFHGKRLENKQKVGYKKFECEVWKSMIFTAID